MKQIKFFLLLFATAVAFAGVLYVWGALFRPTLPEKPVANPPERVRAVEEMRDTSFDPATAPVLQRDVDYSQGKSAAWYPKGESPILAELVKEGKLPPVAERVGEEPLVLEGVDGIGNYGGTWSFIVNSAGDITLVMGTRISNSTLVRWSPMGYPIRPNIARSWEVTPDQKEWTFFLRKGMNWSDGHPFTTDDIMYWWEWEEKYFNQVRPQWLTVGGKPCDIVKIDDYTVKFVFPEPYGTFLEKMATTAGGGIYSPKHYLEQFHPELGNKELIKAAMSARGAGSPRSLYFAMKDARNSEHPRLGPWVYRTFKASPPEGFVRNPYYFAVDSQGNQLPYVDRILFEVKNLKLIPIAAAAGDATMQPRYLTFDNYTMLMEGAEKNGYQVYHWFPASRSVWTIWPNTNRRADPDDPAGQERHDLLADKRFRQALSLAINRREIIDAYYNGDGEPAQISPGRESPFHNEKLMKSFTEFDPARANALLDELGLTKRDSEGMRTFSNGERMVWYINFTEFTGEGPAQFVIDDWADVGIRAIQRERSRGIFGPELTAGVLDFTVWTGESEFNPMVEPRSFVAVTPESFFAPLNGLWYMRGGFFGNPEAAKSGVAPPPGGPIRKGEQILNEALRAGTTEEQAQIFNQALDIAAEQVWSISIATPPPQLVVVKNGFKNVPRNVIFGFAYQTPANSAPETYFFEKPSDSPGAIAQIKQEMTTITPPPDAVNTDTLAKVKSGGVGRLISTLLIGLVVVGIVLAGVRHPYIGRRLLIMIPTLLIISIATFGIIQLPPGDYIQTRIMELQMTGDTNSIKDIEELRETFHLEDPVWKQYLRWLGIRWFFTFKPEDKGLLQGDMGRSMSTNRSVNDMVGDRVLLTFLISLGTILFTWAIAMPIGIYSAVKQYSPGDYVLTFVGFIGMCVPNFLLAIIMMYWSGKYLGINVTGLFSPEFAATPEWSLAKVNDLLKHIWVPIVVIATSGTAGMIRVMRGNLLDELRRPYVTTAMAKGVRPFKLLMKYPVRLALNPFISGIGGIFPQLVSGGAIVAIVLSLPMVGPILLDGLMLEDVYLAGSMLMVLSLLGILGTLVSDLMLLWLDPRIRMEGGAK